MLRSQPLIVFFGCLFAVSGCQVPEDSQAVVRHSIETGTVKVAVGGITPVVLEDACYPVPYQVFRSCSYEAVEAITSISPSLISRTRLADQPREFWVQGGSVGEERLTVTANFDDGSTRTAAFDLKVVVADHAYLYIDSDESCVSRDDDGDIALTVVADMDHCAVLALNSRDDILGDVVSEDGPIAVFEDTSSPSTIETGDDNSTCDFNVNGRNIRLPAGEYSVSSFAAPVILYDDSDRVHPAKVRAVTPAEAAASDEPCIQNLVDG